MQGVIFDFDGTIFDSNYVWATAGERFFQSIGISPKPNLQEEIRTMSLYQSACYIRKEYDLSLTVVEIMEGINQTVEDAYFHEVQPKVDVIPFLHALKNAGIRVRYLHSEVDTLERMEILRDLRMDVFDVLVGINLLREGLDLPEVSLVAILDADKEGFLRSETSLIQTIGRAARNAEGKVIMYADSITPSMRSAIEETERRRGVQDAFNKEHGIVPKTVYKSVRELIEISHDTSAKLPTASRKKLSLASMEDEIHRLERQMKEASKMLEFEYAAVLRDQIRDLRKQLEEQKTKKK